MIAYFCQLRIKVFYRDREFHMPQNARFLKAIVDFCIWKQNASLWFRKPGGKINRILYDDRDFFAPLFRIDDAIFCDEHLIAQAWNGFASP